MSTETQEPMEMGTKPQAEHDWLKNLEGNWRTESQMTMPDGSQHTSTGTETVELLGGLWASTTGSAGTPGEGHIDYRTGLGYDVSFKEYRGFWIANMSSHLWTYKGTLSADGKTMTLDCVGPHMERDGETANYRDVVEIQDNNHRTMTSYGQDEAGEWHSFMKVSYTRA